MTVLSNPKLYHHGSKIWFYTVCSGLTYEIYSGGGPSTYIYCVVCYCVMSAPYVRSVVVSLHTITLLIMILYNMYRCKHESWGSSVLHRNLGAKKKRPGGAESMVKWPSKQWALPHHPQFKPKVQRTEQNDVPIKHTRVSCLIHWNMNIVIVIILDFIQFLYFLTVCFVYYCVSFYVFFVWTLMKISKLLNMLSR